MEFKEFFSLILSRVDARLKIKIDSLDNDAADLKEAMTYGLMLGGKRSRPFLVYATAKALGLDFSEVDNAACAVECIHAYSLIHDDMPEMDNDELRRGLPSVHKKFGQATALLAGDALQTLAFEFLSDNKNNPCATIKMVSLLSALAGYKGMCGGQAMDLAAEGCAVGLETMQLLHSKKTGALICASVLMAASLLDESESTTYDALHTYAKKVGVAFQIWDDVLDVIGDTSILGKKAGSDISLDKSTYPSLLGLDKARELAIKTASEAVEALDAVASDTSLLREFALFCVQRDH